jgi:hypothetical protein
MTEKKRKTLYWVFKIASVLISCALPIWAICERFPLWTETHGRGYSFWAGIILIIFVIIIIFRKSVFGFIREKLNLKYAPPIVIWLVLLIGSYLLIYIGDVMRDMTSILWMGLIGCAIGNVLTYISERLNAKDVTSNE